MFPSPPQGESGGAQAEQDQRRRLRSDRRGGGVEEDVVEVAVIGAADVLAANTQGSERSKDGLKLGLAGGCPAGVIEVPARCGLEQRNAVGSPGAGRVVGRVENQGD